MITAYKVRYVSATNSNSSGFAVTRIDDNKTKKTPYNYGVNNAIKHSIHEAFGEDTARIEFVGSLDKNNSLYVVIH